MKITDISCSQFAGVRDRSVSFGGGLNIIYGKNESGKSTLVNLISRVLFQDVKLDKRSDRDFFDQYFPAGTKNGAGGDFADGKLAFETDRGRFVLSKRWGGSPDCVLSAPDGIFRDMGRIAEELKRALVWGEGVYSEMLLSSQRNTDLALQKILGDAGSDKLGLKEEILRAITQAFAESDKLPTDLIAQSIQAKLIEFDADWDAAQEMPKRKAGGGRWQKGFGELVKAYYALEDAKRLLEEFNRLESAAFRAKADYAASERELSDAEKIYEEFHNFFHVLTERSARQREVDRLKERDDEGKKVLAEWPVLAEKIERANILQAELKNADLLALYRSAKKLQDGVEKLQAERAKCPDAEEFRRFTAVLGRIRELENKLRGMNLNADIRMLGGNSVKVTSLCTGEALKAEGSISISEAVKITVPGVMEMELTPANVNVEEVQKSLDECRSERAKILQKYQAESADEFEKLNDLGVKLERQASALTMELCGTLGGKDLALVEAEIRKIETAPRDREHILSDIDGLCGGDLSKFLGAAEGRLNFYRERYASVDALKAEARNVREDLERAQRALEDVLVPTGYEGVTDPAGKLEDLKKNIAAAKRRNDEAFKAKTEACVNYEKILSENEGDLKEDYDAKRRALEEEKQLYRHWVHIYEVFEEQKAKIESKPLLDIAQNFAKNLSMISGGRDDSQFRDADNLSPEIYSLDKKIDYQKLSEGTKETASLAFRLAVLDHLFPNGGGIVVLDDPFANMDRDRTERSIALVEEHARRHQVIFLTCKEELFERMEGTKIKI